MLQVIYMQHPFNSRVLLSNAEIIITGRQGEQLKADLIPYVLHQTKTGDEQQGQHVACEKCS